MSMVQNHTNIRAKREKLSELRIFLQTDLQTEEGPFTRNIPCGNLSLEGTHLLSCQTDLMHLFPAFPSCWNLKRSAIIYLWHASEETLPNPPMAHFLPLYMTAASSSYSTREATWAVYLKFFCILIYNNMIFY